MINSVLILLYFVFDVADIALSVIPEFNILWKFISIVFPWGIIYFTAPRTNKGSKFTVSIWGLILIFYYIYNGNVQIKGNEYLHQLTGSALIREELYSNMIVAIILSFFAFLSGLGVVYHIKEKHKNSKNDNTTNIEETIEYIYYDENGNISDIPTSHAVRK